MAFWSVANAALITGWENAMIGALWQGSLVLLLVWSIVRLFPKIYPAIQCWLWRLACLKLLIALIWFKPLKLYIHLQIGIRLLGWLLANSPPSRHLAKMTQSLWKTAPPLPAPSGKTGFLFLFWLAGLLIMSVGIYWGHRRRSSRHYAPVADPTIISLYQDLGRRIKCRKMPLLFSAECYSSPLLQGIIHPQIIIPVSMMTEFTDEQLRVILSHELAHYKRGDLFWNWLPALTRTLFFFFPFIWGIEKKIAQLQEICCDRLAVQYAKTSAAKFGNILLQVSLQQEALRTTGSQARASISFAAQSLTLLKNRLRALHSNPPSNRKQMMITGGILLMLGIAALIPWQFAQADMLPVNMWINYHNQDKLEVSAHVILPQTNVIITKILIDDNPINATYNSSGIYFGYSKPHNIHFPMAGPHKVTVEAITNNGVFKEQNWIYYQNAMNWSNLDLGKWNDKTVIKIGPFFWIINHG